MTPQSLPSEEVHLTLPNGNAGLVIQNSANIPAATVIETATLIQFQTTEGKIAPLNLFTERLGCGCGRVRMKHAINISIFLSY